MTKQPSTPDVSVRGGVVNVPPSTKPLRPPRHQPDTPRTKKTTKVRPDHQLHGPDPSASTKDTPPPPTTTPDEPAATAAEPAAPPPDEPVTDLDE